MFWGNMVQDFFYFIFFFGRCWEFGTRTLGLGAAAAIAASCCRPGSGLVVNQIRIFANLSKIFTEILLVIGGGRRHSGRPAPGGCASLGLRWETSPEEAGTAQGGFSSAVGKGEKRPGKVEAASAQPPVCLGSPSPLRGAQRGRFPGPIASFPLLYEFIGIGSVNTKITKRPPAPLKPRAAAAGPPVLGTEKPGSSRGAAEAKRPSRLGRGAHRVGCGCPADPTAPSALLSPEGSGSDPSGVRPRLPPARSASPPGRPRGGRGGESRRAPNSPEARPGGLPPAPNQPAAPDRCGPGCRGWK